MKQREAANGGIPRKSVSICLCVFLLPLHLQRLLLPQVADDQQARHFNLVTTREFDGGRVAFGLGCTWGNDRPLHPKQDGALQHFNLVTTREFDGGRVAFGLGK